MRDVDFAEFLQTNQIDGLLSFLYSIDWRDPWIIGLVFFHIAVFLTAISTRRHGTFQALLFFMLLLLVYFSENINQMASTNWRIFSRQQYFDSNGLFISIVFSMPILLNCMMMVVSIVRGYLRRHLGLPMSLHQTTNAPITELPGGPYLPIDESYLLHISMSADHSSMGLSAREGSLSLSSEQIHDYPTVSSGQDLSLPEISQEDRLSPTVSVNKDYCSSVESLEQNSPLSTLSHEQKEKDDRPTLSSEPELPSEPELSSEPELPSEPELSSEPELPSEPEWPPEPIMVILPSEPELPSEQGGQSSLSPDENCTFTLSPIQHCRSSLSSADNLTFTIPSETDQCLSIVSTEDCSKISPQQKIQSAEVWKEYLSPTLSPEPGRRYVLLSKQEHRSSVSSEQDHISTLSPLQDCNEQSENRSATLSSDQEDRYPMELYEHEHASFTSSSEQEYPNIMIPPELDRISTLSSTQDHNVQNQNRSATLSSKQDESKPMELHEQDHASFTSSSEQEHHNIILPPGQDHISTLSPIQGHNVQIQNLSATSLSDQDDRDPVELHEQDHASSTSSSEQEHRNIIVLSEQYHISTLSPIQDNNVQIQNRSATLSSDQDDRDPIELHEQEDHASTTSSSEQEHHNIIVPPEQDHISTLSPIQDHNVQIQNRSATLSSDQDDRDPMELHEQEDHASTTSSSEQEYRNIIVPPEQDNISTLSPIQGRNVQIQNLSATSLSDQNDRDPMELHEQDHASTTSSSEQDNRNIIVPPEQDHISTLSPIQDNNVQIQNRSATLSSDQDDRDSMELREQDHASTTSSSEQENRSVIVPPERDHISTLSPIQDRNVQIQNRSAALSSDQDNRDPVELHEQDHASTTSSSEQEHRNLLIPSEMLQHIPRVSGHLDDNREIMIYNTLIKILENRISTARRDVPLSMTPLESDLQAMIMEMERGIIFPTLGVTLRLSESDLRSVLSEIYRLRNIRLLDLSEP